MINYTEALGLLREAGRLRRFSHEQVSFREAVGRVLAAPLLGTEPVPGFDNSAMDGFAVRAADTAGASDERPVRLPVSALVVAGDRGTLDGAPHGAVEIMTGAPVPLGGFDAVVRVEDAEVVRDASGVARELVLRRSASTGDYVRKRGEDYRPGALVLEAGRVVRPDHLLALAALGITRLPVVRRPRVAIIATGRELVDAETPALEPGMIRNSTTPYLLAALEALGADVRWVGTVPDDPVAFARVWSDVVASGADLVITTGAVSVGKHDFIARSLVDAGAHVRFHKVAIRPGKPILFAEAPQGPAVIGLPGNPISTAVGLRFFVEPFLRAARGLADERPLMARLADRCVKPGGLRCFYKARLSLEPAGPTVEVLPGQASFIVRTLTEANAWVVFEEGASECAAGMAVDVYPLLPEPTPGLLPSPDSR